MRRIADARRASEARLKAQQAHEAEKARAAEAAKAAEEDAARAAEAAREAEAERKADAARTAAAEQAAEVARQKNAAREAEAAQEAARAAEQADQEAAVAHDPEPDADGAAPAAPTQAEAPVAKNSARGTTTADPWDALRSISVDERQLDRNRVITAGRHDPAHTAFDVLRTRLLQALAEHGWTRVAITSPTKDCGKTFTAANLAISLSRQENCRTLLLDCDLRRPSLHRVLGVEPPGAMGDMLRGVVPPEQHMLRMGPNTIHAGHNIAFGFNTESEPYASELLQDPRTAATLDDLQTRFAPDVMLFDLPPALFYDDVIAFRPLFDGVLMVVGGGITTEREVREVERRLGDSTPLLGTVLNRAEDTQIRKYSY
ncbi:CpsD/CapB family tyrosine-protein kinase [Salipiger mucosus]|nr:CpsD/CapB family tyrosine-protein kinase [Salipiger mucosus]